MSPRKGEQAGTPSVSVHFIDALTADLPPPGLRLSRQRVAYSYAEVHPASIGMIAPLMCLASSEARKSARFAISVGFSIAGMSA